MTRVFSLTIALALAAGTHAVAQQATVQDFEAFQRAMAGRWVGEVTWIADWPGMGKKGDKVTAYSQIEVAAGGHALLGHFHGGNGTGRWITTYDAASKQIREMGSDSGDTSWICTITMDSGKFRSRCEGALADGTKTTGDNTLTISDGGNTQRWRGTNTIGGQAADPLQDVWRRVGR